MIVKSETELAEAVASAKGPLRIQGGGTRPIGWDGKGEVLSTSGLSGITLYEPGALTIVAQAGTPVAEIETALAAEGQRLPFEPMDHRSLLDTKGVPTIGGVVAGNVSGPRRIAVGACRDFLLGVRFVNGQGTILKNGGRVMKNVTGYDLVKLMAGSFGTLGVLSEVALKVLPMPETVATLVYRGDWAAASQMFARAMSSPFEVNGAALVPERDDGLGRIVLRVEGFDASVTYRAKQIAALLAQEPEQVITNKAENAQLWQHVRNVVPFKNSGQDVWRISAKPSDCVAVADALELGPRDVLFDWAGGLIWASLPTGTDVRGALTGIGGHAMLVRGSGVAFQPEPKALSRISTDLRTKFDPRGILNPGLMG